MPLSINRDVFITCAVTGAGDTVSASPHVPITPKQIAKSAIDAAKAGAAVVHCHVRDPETGAASRRLDLYREVTDRIRSADVDVVLNLTAGMGGDIVFGDVEAPLPVNAKGTDMAGATERVAHVADCLPEICTLDCGTMNFNLGDYVMTNTPSMLREMARQMTALGVKPEIEAFDTGHLWFAQQLAAEGLIEDPVLIQLCMGIRWGAPDDLNTLMAMVNNVPAGWTFSAFSIGRNALAYPAAAVLAGGNVRVGLEDNLYIGKRELAHQCATRGKSSRRRDGDGRPDHGTARGSREAQAGEALRRRHDEFDERADETSRSHFERRLHRRRRHRRGLDRPLSHGRRRCEGVRPASGGGARRRRGDRQCRTRLRPSDRCASSAARASDLQSKPQGRRGGR